MKISKSPFLMLACLATLGAAPKFSVAAQSLHVATTGNDANSGSAGAPLRNIQTALNRITAGDTVKVAAGMYAENITTRVRVILRGGYDATFAEPARNIFKNRSIFRSAAGTYLSDANSSTIDGFIFDGSVGASKAVVVTAGHAIVTHNVFHSFFSSFATGVDVPAGASVTVKNNTFANNILSGGGTLIYILYIRGNADGAAVVENNIVFNNNVGVYLGAAGITANYNCVFGNTYRNYDGPNAAPGANDLTVNPVFVNASNSDFRLKASSPCNDAGNPSDPLGEEPAPNGGRIDMGAYGGTKHATSATLNPSTYVSTLGSDSNPGTLTAPLRNIQTALSNAVGDTIKVAAGTYSEGLLVPARVVLRGGYDESFAEPRRDIFANLTTLRGISATMIHDRFGSTIDGLFLDGNAVAQTGFDIGAGSVVTHNIVTRVSSGSGYGIKMSGNAMVVNNTVRFCTRAISIESGSAGSTVKNNIFANNSFAISNSVANGIARYNDFFSNSFNYTGGFTTPGLGDLAVDPQFRNATANDFRLLTGSLCINAGDPADPVGEEPQPNGGRIDMGAYGGTKNAPTIFSAPALVSPANNATGQPLTPTLNWNAVAGATSYRLEVSYIAALITVIVVEDSSLTATSKQIGPLSNNTTYFWRVKAKNSGGQSAWSSVFRFTTSSGAPAAPKDLQATAGDRQVTLTWTANSEADFLRYRIYGGTAPNPAAKLDSVAGAANTTKTITGLTNGTTYFFRITAVNSALQESGFSNEVSTAPAANRPPVVANAISNQTITVGGVPFTRNLNSGPAVFSDPDGDALTYTASSSAANIATANISGSTLTVAPVAGGSATITVTANDGRGGTVSTTFMVTVNRPPVVSNPIADKFFEPGTSSFTNLNAVFSDSDGDVLSYTASSSNPAIATASATGASLNMGYVSVGIVTITVVADDGRGGIVPMMFKVTCLAPNRAPTVANPISNQILTVGGPSFSRDLNASPPVFSDPDGDVLSYSASSSAAGVATATITGSTLRTSPVAGGTATITVTANDGRGRTVSMTFMVTVGTSSNQPPVVANAISNQTLNVGGAPFTRNLNAAPVVFTDPNGDTLTYTASSSATNIATVSIAGSTLTVTPVTAGNATITVTANDGRGGAVSTTFSVIVSPAANRSPVVTNVISNQNLTVGSAPFTRDLNAAPAVFNDPDGDPLGYTASSNASNIATASISANTLTVTPVAVGNTTITVTASDNRGGTVSTTFTVTVTGTNRAPVVTSSIPNQTLTAGGAVFTRNLNSAPAVFNDPDGDPLTYTAVSSAGNIATATISGSTLTVAPVAAGSATIMITANDGRGGSVSTSFGVTVRSNLPPSITHTATALAQNSLAIPISANVTDDNGVANVQLNFRRGGAASFSAVTMISTGGAGYQALIPASEVTSQGVEYFILVTDVDNAQTRRPVTGSFSIQIQVSNAAKPSTQPSGSAQTAFRLISVPLQLDNPSATAVLEDDLGPYNDAKWRLFGLAPVTSQDPNNKTPYVEFRTGGDLSPGKSLFLIVADPGKTITIGAAKSVQTDQEFQITLQRGHNFIGAPFNFTVPANKLRLQSGASVTLWTYNGSFTPATELQPWEGYYVANLNQNSDVLLINPNLSASMPARVANQTGWRLRILASCGQARDDYNFAGVAATSADGWDDNDLAEPPPIGDFVSLYFPHPEWQKPLARFSDDLRAIISENHQWHFHVVTNIPNETVTLRFAGLREIDPALDLWLVDDELKSKQNLRENATYQYLPRRVEFATAFTLIAGKKEFVDEQTTNIRGVPDEFVLEQNFPNPFSASGIFDNPETAIRFGLPQQSVVTIKIFDLAGHEIATPLDRVELPAGRHQRVWDGRDAQGRTVTSGIYFYRLSAGSFAKTIKLMLMR